MESHFRIIIINELGLLERQTQGLSLFRLLPRGPLRSRLIRTDLKRRNRYYHLQIGIWDALQHATHTTRN